VPELLREQAVRGEPWTLREVKLEVEGPVAIITMNRPQAMNALNTKVWAELKEAILASSEARMGFPEVGLGIFPGVGGTQRSARLVGKGRACELIFTGDMISAEEAEHIGLLNRVVPPQELMKTARTMAEKIASRAPLAVGRAKTAINKTLETHLDAGLAFEVESVCLLFSTEDKEEGMAAFVERRKPEFKGS
jgi:enoyl-CoA hydratase